MTVTVRLDIFRHCTAVSDLRNGRFVTQMMQGQSNKELAVGVDDLPKNTLPYAHILALLSLR
jgi:hypothetical protein